MVPQVTRPDRRMRLLGVTGGVGLLRDRLTALNPDTRRRGLQSLREALQVADVSAHSSPLMVCERQYPTDSLLMAGHVFHHKPDTHQVGIVADIQLDNHSRQHSGHTMGDRTQ